MTSNLRARDSMPFFFFYLRLNLFFFPQLIFLSNGAEDATVSYPRVVVKADDDSHLSFTQSYISRGGVCLANGLTRIILGERANVVRALLSSFVLLLPPPARASGRVANYRH